MADIFDGMVWSYSRLQCFYDCPNKWQTKYIYEFDSEDLFFSSYGRFMHYLIDKFYSEGASRQSLVIEYLSEFQNKVVGVAPNLKVYSNYFESGLRYLKNIKSFHFLKVETENKYEFKIGQYNFVGYVDYVGLDRDGFVIVDNKSRNLKPRSTRKKPTLNDKELDEFYKQLYIYSAAIYQKYGEFPRKLCFNCFREGVFIEEDFSMEKYEQALKWAYDTIDLIKAEEDFGFDTQFFKCKYLCDVHNHCEMYEFIERGGW